MISGKILATTVKEQTAETSYRTKRTRTGNFTVVYPNRIFQYAVWLAIFIIWMVWFVYYGTKWLYGVGA